MKHMFRYILSSVAMLLPVLAYAQIPRLRAAGTELPDPPIYADYNIDGGVGTKKTVGDPNTNGVYEVTLETFATGKTEIVQSTMPADIVLVLDVSGSMEDNMPGTTQYTYHTATTNSSWTPNDISTGNNGNTDWYYKHTDGNYYRIYRQRSGSWPNYTYRYRVTISGSNYYLTGTGIESSASYVGANAFVYNGTLYTQSQGRSKMDALKQAVEAFVNTVNHNALYDQDDNLRGTPVDHQISVVKFAGARYLNNSESSVTAGNDRYTQDGYSYNYTQVRIGFTNVKNTQGVWDVINAVSGLQEGGATAADYGMTKAWYLLNQPAIKNRKSNKVVVMFTDGEPNHSRNFDETVAGNTIEKAKDLKDDFEATVYTVGVFDTETTNLRRYMHWTSSNYPDAEGWQDTGTDDNFATHDKGYYQNASNADLTEIFSKIASSASSTVGEIEATTQVVDVVSNSFEVPSDFDADDVTVSTRAINRAGTAFGTDVPLTVINLTDDSTFDPNAAPPETAEYMTDDNKVGVYLKDGKLIILGFNYSKADSPDADGSSTKPYGNWVGFREADVCAGKELVIKFNIQGDPNATGGDGTNTNMPNSGVYILVDGEYVPINKYEVPHKNLPINIVIEKSGLRAGESATVQIYRCKQKTNEEGEVQYNERTGKPLPSGTMPTKTSDDPTKMGWENFTKVILTNTTGIDLKPVTKTLLSLHADYVYLLMEDNWGWAYILDDGIMSTDEVEKNPFKFDNTENPEAVKHAEAAAINHFGNGYTDEDRVKTYKSSKTILSTNSD